MPKVVVTAAVKDGTSYVAADGSGHVATTWDVPDMEAFMAAQSRLSPELMAAREQAGMIPPLVIYVEK